MLSVTTANKIRHLRKAAKLTQTELGDKLGVKKNAVSKWECGRVDDIPASKIKAMANLFNVPVSFLIDDEEPGTAAAMYHINLPLARREAVLEEGQMLFPDFIVIGSDGKSEKYTYPDPGIPEMWKLINKIFELPPQKLEAAARMVDALISVK